MQLQPGQSIGRYQILEPLGEGGMANVYKAFDTRLERRVALKIIRTGVFPPDSLARILKRFEREARSLAGLSHPHIVNVLDYGDHEEAPYLVLEYLPGGTLAQRLGKPLPYLEAVRLLLLVGRALDYAHQRGIIHRDVKPSNILIGESGDPKLADFGIAKIMEGDSGMTLTGTGVGIGTPEYMAPEQGLGQPVDGRADVYALGIVFYELVTGRKPYIADTPMAVVLKHITDPLPLPRSIAPGLPEAVEQVLLKALAKKPEDRYLDMGAFIAALEKLLGHAPASTAQDEYGLEDEATLSDLVLLDGGNTLIQAQALPQTHSDKLDHSQRTVFEGKRTPARPRWLVWAAVLPALALLLFGAQAVFRMTVNTPPPQAAPASQTPPAAAPEAISTPTGAPPAAVSPTQAGSADLLPTPTSAPADLSYAKLITDAKGVPMALVPAGEFFMGSESGSSQEKPVHTVYLDAFYIDLYEVTNAQYAQCVQDGACRPPQEDPWNFRSPYYTSATFADYPVVGVGWSDAASYCTWRAGQLPTEAQWEKAARGGLEGKRFPWGDEFPVCDPGAVNGAVSVECQSLGFTRKTGSYAPNGYGLYDMAGNVWEWVADWYSDTYYQVSPASNPTGPASGNLRTVRGGSWYATSRGALTVSNRMGVYQLNKDNYTGFRCALSAVDAPGAGPTDTPTDTPIPSLPSQVSDRAGVSMALVPAGEFKMGRYGVISNEQPIHTVYLDAYYIDVYEVTNASYAACVQAGMCTAPKEIITKERFLYYDNPNAANHAVSSVSWYEAESYCAWREASLPTEAEWEKAARGGLEEKDFPWGNEEPVCTDGALNGAIYYGCSPSQQPQETGRFAPNGYGIYDMAGNVGEWVKDWFSGEYYHTSPFANPGGPDQGNSKVIRGGSWNNHSKYLKIAYRSEASPDYRNASTGFRCARRAVDFEPLTMTDQPPAHPAAPDSEDTSPPADGMVDVKGVSMVLVPAGDFMMGSENGDASEQPAHTVTLDAFYIDRFEVTNDRYAECVQAGYCSAPTQSGSYNRTSYYGDARYGGYPVVYVSWQDAYEYCAWRGVRLPTEAEWEKAARGGLDGKRYPWGNEAPSCTLGAWNGANYGACESPDDTWKVGSFGPNLYGVYDMAGNVWEWVADRYSDSYYRTSPPENPPGPVSGALRTVRGGAWGSDLVFLRVAARSGAPPADSSHTVGFRCAVPAGP